MGRIITAVSCPWCVLCFLNIRFLKKPIKIYNWVIWVTIVFAMIVTFLKAMVWSQRLAFLSLVIPLLVLYYRLILGSQRKKGVFLYPWAILFLAILVFGIGLLVRAYHNLVVSGDLNIGGLLLINLFGYYAGSVNNALALFNQPTINHTLGAYSFAWFWTFPVLGREYGLVDIYHQLMGGYEVAHSY